MMTANIGLDFKKTAAFPGSDEDYKAKVLALARETSEKLPNFIAGTVLPKGTTTTANEQKLRPQDVLRALRSFTEATPN